MPFLTNIIPTNPDRVLVIDEMPLVSLAMQEIFRTVNTSVLVEYTDSIFQALSSKNYDKLSFDLIIIGQKEDVFPGDLSQLIQELKGRFPKAGVMLFAAIYDPAVMEKMEEWDIAAYVHKYEPLEEIRRTYLALSSGKPYISAIFRSLYADYRLGR